jgi:hypothetical protein
MGPGVNQLGSNQAPMVAQSVALKNANTINTSETQLNGV